MAIQVGMSVKHLDGCCFSCRAPVVDSSVGNDSEGCVADPFPECDVLQSNLSDGRLVSLNCLPRASDAT